MGDESMAATQTGVGRHSTRAVVGSRPKPVFGSGVPPEGTASTSM